MQARKAYADGAREGILRRRAARRARPSASASKRTDILGHVTGRTQFYADRTFPGMLHLKMVRSPHHHARILSVDTSRGGEGAGRGAHPHPQGRAEERLHDPLPDPGRAGRRAVPRRRQGPLQGRADRRDLAESAGRRARGGRQGQGRIRGAAGGLRRGGGAEAGRAARQRVPRPELLQIRGPPLPARPLRRRGEGLRPGRPRPRGALPVLADRACADRDDRLHRRAGRERPLRLLFQHAGAVLHARQHRADPQRAVPEAPPDRRHGRRRFRRQGRRDRRADRLPRRDAHQPAGQIRLSAARRRCRSPRRARPSASTSRTA